MANLGTRKFYKSFDGTSNASKKQILKNSGYISILLHSAFYNSKGNFWQKIFGGVDKIALASSITYQSGNKTIEAKNVQDKRKVKAGRNHFLGLSRTVALKVPANADGLELKVELTAVKDDNFENALGLMNSEEFQEPLQLSPIPVGQIISITKVVKKIFTGIEQKNYLDATFAGIISQSKVQDPIQKERLSTGYLIMIANNDEDNDFLSKLDVNKLQVEADGLKHNGKRINHTNLIYSITFEALRGPDQNSKWFSIYNDSLAELDDLLFTTDATDRKRILDESRKLWVEASALLFDDPSYINHEKMSIKASFFKQINERYLERTKVKKDNPVVVNSFLKSNGRIDFIPELKTFEAKNIIKETNKIAANYMKELGNLNMVFPEV